jgi:hypothetical protein
MRYGLRVMRHQVKAGIYRWTFRATMAAAVVVMVATNQDLAERVQIMEAVTEIYEAKVAALEACERGAIGYHYPATGKLFECSKPL